MTAPLCPECDHSIDHHGGFVNIVGCLDCACALRPSNIVRARVEALLAPYKCHQCRGTGQQARGESAPLRSVDTLPPTETCHLCRGSGTIEPIGVQATDLRAALADPEADQ